MKFTKLIITSPCLLDVTGHQYNSYKQIHNAAKRLGIENIIVYANKKCNIGDDEMIIIPHFGNDPIDPPFTWKRLVRILSRKTQSGLAVAPTTTTRVNFLYWKGMKPLRRFIEVVNSIYSHLSFTKDLLKIPVNSETLIYESEGNPFYVFEDTRFKSKNSNSSKS